MTARSTTALTIAALVAFFVTGCGDSPTGASPSGQTSVQLASGSTGGSGSLVSLSAQARGGGADVSLEMVSSVDLTLETVEALRLGAGEESRWISLEVMEQEIDLLELPESGLEVARGELPAGDFCNLRLFVGASWPRGR